MINAIGGLASFIGLIAWLLGLILALASFIASGLNRKRFKEICILYKEKYGSLPPMVEIFDYENSFWGSVYDSTGYSIKMQFIFKPLLWNRSSNFTKNDDKDFIRGLPKRLIGPFYAEIYITAAGLVFFVIGGLLMLATEHHWL